MIDLTMDHAGLTGAVRRARERNVLLPTFHQLTHPETMPDAVRRRLPALGLWDVDPGNLFRITWHNEPSVAGGAFGSVNTLEFPPELTGVAARIVALVGKWFPTGAHKVGAAFGCLVPRLVTGQFNPERQRAVWPSTGNFCRGGAYDAALLGCDSIAVLPEGMSPERFDWLSRIAGRVVKTAGSESNVKEIFDKCNELRHSDEGVVIFNQFEEFGNYLWHYAVTGPAMHSVLRPLLDTGASYRGLVLTTGSAGTIASGDYLKREFPSSKLAASEALQCPTLLRNGYGTHRIEGIGDKHIPWIHNVRPLDMVMAVDDEAPLALLRLFNEPEGHSYLIRRGMSESAVDRLGLVGISGAANLLSAIKFAKCLDLGDDDVVLTVLTDSVDLYQSRIQELTRLHGEFTARDAAAVHERWLLGAGSDNLEELNESGRRRIHNLKYFTWVEQQGRSVNELDRQWQDPSYWSSIAGQLDALDSLIEEFNGRTNLARAA